MRICKSSVVILYLYLFAFAVQADNLEPPELVLPFRPQAIEPIDYAQRQGEPVRIRATRQFKVMTGEGHRSKKNIVAIYIGLPMVDEAQDNVIIEDVKSNQNKAYHMAFSTDAHTLWIQYIDVEPGFSDVISLTFSVDLYERRATISNMKPYDRESPLYKRYTSPSLYTHSSVTEGEEDQDFKFLRAAKVLPDMNPILKSKRIYDYIHKELAYGQPTDILNGTRAHCGIYANLFAKLCQVAGVPARRCAGFAFGDHPESNEKGVAGHNWAEIYIEGVGWIPIDPTMGDKSDIRKRYYFGAIDNARLCISKSGFHDQLPLCYKTSADGDIIFTHNASDFKAFKHPDTIQGVHKFQYRFDWPIHITVPDRYGESLTVLSRHGQFTKPLANPNHAVPFIDRSILHRP